MALISGSQTITTANLTDLLDGGASALHSHAIADDSIVEAKFDVSNGPSNDYFLQAQSGEGGGLTWAAGGTLTTIISGTRTASAGAGNQALTGVGFRPTGLIALGTVAGTTFASWGIVDDAVAETSSAMYAGNVWIRDDDFIYSSPLDGNYMTARVLSLDTDGCTLTWTKGGTGYDVVYRILFLG